MSEHSKTITREELYEEVWRMPVSALASVWMVSASSITKACGEMNVPLPASNYWQLVGGQPKIERQPLPPASEDILPQTVLLTAQPQIANSGKVPKKPQLNTECSRSWKLSADERSGAIDAFEKIETAVRLIRDAIADYPRLEALQLDPLLRELSQGMQILALDDSELDLRGLMLKHEWKVGQRFYVRAKVQDGSHSRFLVLAAQDVPENIVITGHVRRPELRRWQIVGLDLEIRRKDSNPAWHIRAIDL